MMPTFCCLGSVQGGQGWYSKFNDKHLMCDEERISVLGPHVGGEW